MAQQPLVGQCFIIIKSSRSVTPHSEGILRTSDQPDAQISTWQHTTLTTDIYDTDRIRTRNPSNSAAADPHFWPHSHWDRLRDKDLGALNRLQKFNSTFHFLINVSDKAGHTHP